MKEGNEVEQLIGHLFRHEAGKMTAVLYRLLGVGNGQIAEDIVQDTLLKAMETWGFHGVPQNPQAWLYTVAKNKALDFVRSKKRHELIHSELAELHQSGWAVSASVNMLFLENEIQDSQLRMMFACCHPSISEESQIALTLKTLCGLSTLEIASAFLTSEETIQKRIFRAKEKLREQHIKLEVPPVEALPLRLDAVLRMIYLLFNEGYYSTNSENQVRLDLCEEAVRLNYLLLQSSDLRLPKVQALMALMCLQSSRFPSRHDKDGATVLLQHQDRSRWNQELMNRGFSFLEEASRGNELSDYHIEASIAAVHATAKSFEETNWLQLVTLYEVLFSMKPSPIIAMNKAIAVGYATHPERGVQELLSIQGLEQNHFYYAALGRFYQLDSKKNEALTSFQKALSLAKSTTDIDFLKSTIGTFV
jgi:RNA polymerase sigma factor (sigma-70 family)